MEHHPRPAGRSHVGRRLPARVAEELHSILESSVAFVAKFPTPPPTDEAVFRLMLQRLGYSELAIRDLATLSAEKTGAALRMAQEARAEALKPGKPGQQRVVDVRTVEAWIDRGWRFVSPLHKTKAVIESPRA